MKVYFISGLGADERAFQSLELNNIEPIYLNWIAPLKRESIESYAKRMAEGITEPNPVIVGLSFGGMVAIEIAKIIAVRKLILISSAKGRNELPPYFRAGRYIPLHKVLPVSGTFLITPIIFYVNNIKNKNQKKILKEIINSSSNKVFIQWAVDRIVNWNNKEKPTNIVHIHGDADKLLPYKYVKADHTIKNGGHFMIVNQAKEISALLNKLIPIE